MKCSIKTITFFTIAVLVVTNQASLNSVATQTEIDALNIHNIVIANDNYVICSNNEANMFILNQRTSEIKNLGKFVLSNHHEPAIIYKDNVISFDNATDTLKSFNLETGNLAWSFQVKNDYTPIPWGLIPSISSNVIYMYIDHSLVEINADNGELIAPQNFDYRKVMTHYCVCNIIDDTLVIDAGLKMVFLDINTKIPIKFSIYGKSGSGRANSIHDYFFKYNDKYYMQNNAVSGQGFRNSFLEEIDITEKRTINQYENQYSSGIWINHNIAYVFPLYDKQIIAFNLDNKSSNLLDIPEFYLPLGLYNNYLYYCSKDSIIKRDLDGKLVEKFLIGNVTYNNCKMFNNKIYYVDGEKLKIINLDEVKSNPPPFNLIEWIIRLILDKLKGLP
jgi:hypothetical protein